MNAKKSKSKNETSQSATNEAPIEESTLNPAPEPIAETVGSDEKTSAKKSKPQKTKVIRDSFSFPEHDYRKISELKKTCLAAGTHVKKSEILRAGLYLLTQANPDELKKAIENVEKVPTGRPSSATE
jgi:cyclopropane fatty-acyl-phospholipid synthase-like methyltransferase